MNATTLLLEPLGDAEATRLLAALAGPVALPAEVARRITGAAEGNPLFLEELLAALVEEGWLRRSDGRWVKPTSATWASRPASRRCSRPAWTGSRRPSGRWNGPRSPGRCSSRAPWSSFDAALATRGRSRPGCRPWSAASQAAPDAVAPRRRPGFQFRHPVAARRHLRLHPQAGLAELHELFAVWVERVAGLRLREIEEIVGYHLEQAWRYRVELGVTDQRNHAQDRGGPPAGRGRPPGAGPGRPPAASKLLERAVSLALAGDLGGLELLVELADVLVSTGDFPRAEALLGQVARRRRPRRRAPGRPCPRRAAGGWRWWPAWTWTPTPSRKRPAGPSPPSPSSRTSGAWPRRGGCWPPSGSCAAASPRPRRRPGRP